MDFQKFRSDEADHISWRRRFHNVGATEEKGLSPGPSKYSSLDNETCNKPILLDMVGQVDEIGKRQSDRAIV